MRGPKPAEVVRKHSVSGTMWTESHHHCGHAQGYEDTFPPCCLPSGGEAPGSDFSGQQSRHRIGQRQVTGHDLAWKLEQIRFLMSQSASSCSAGIRLGSQLLITAGVKMPAAGPGAACAQLGGQLPSLCSAEGGWQGPCIPGREAILVKGPAAQLVVYRFKGSHMQRCKWGRASWKRWPQLLYSGLR